MRITKHHHAMLELVNEDKTLVIDPGMYQTDLPELENVVAVVFTHLHDDHSFAPHAKALAQLPGVQFLGPKDVAAKLSEIDIQVVAHGDFVKVGPFELEFSGDLHQEIHRSIPLVQNVGVTVNRELFYPGDAYVFPEHSFEILACPSAAPWMKISDLIDYLEELRPKAAFPTHNAILSDFGNVLQNNRIKEFVEKHGGEFRYLLPGESWS
ncbi:MBL fold metallo-hydrolase [Aquiluna sp. KACHI24]|uniref:MBL fold metallo-hydrolase n=1 Tax=Aquiluna sp. KACHI24 TaxID=2968831 RepID=UPI00220FA752|nr:MBL fold metallo-hydrolase [Aquiluna sp. KACHI24]BDP99997.1 MBL fold metallo-hydrolase [Aquiluna sp. KACHI24]